jgi:general stress protein 26
MGEITNLHNKEAIEKMKEMFGDGQILIFCCGVTTFPIQATPMSTQTVDDDGIVWFFSAKNSDRNRLLKEDPRAQLLYSDTSKMDYMSIQGKAEVLIDVSKAEELWSKHVEVWFPEGPTDPNLSLIKFTPKEGYYWDTKHGKIVSTLKWATAMVTGSEDDDSVEGRMKV